MVGEELVLVKVSHRCMAYDFNSFSLSLAVLPLTMFTFSFSNSGFFYLERITYNVQPQVNNTNVNVWMPLQFTPA